MARERAEQLVREVTDLYGAVLERMMEIALAADPDSRSGFAADDLVASLLPLHGCIRTPPKRRVVTTLDSGAALPELRTAATCPPCSRWSETLWPACSSRAVARGARRRRSRWSLAVEDAVRAAALEISSIEVVAAEKDTELRG